MKGEYIMKRTVIFLTTLFLCAAMLGACAEDPTVVSDKPKESATATTTETATETADTPDVKTESLPDMPMEFIFSSGAGGWGTFVTLQSDGSFAGDYYDSNMGETGNGYPNGSRYECNFNGKFTDVVKISDYEYSMKIAYLNTDGTRGEEKIINGINVITSDPYGFDDAGEFILYLPGRNTSDLPEEFINWVQMPMGLSDMPATLPFYGLYNVNAECGFFS